MVSLVGSGKHIVLALASALLLSAAANAEETEHTPYFDVQEGDPCYEYVMEMHRRGVLGGDAESLFHPDAPVSCGEYYTLLSKLVEADLEAYQSPDRTHWAYAAGNWVRGYQGVIGEEADLSDAGLAAPITRQQAVELAMRVYGYYKPTAVEHLENPFSDIVPDCDRVDGDNAYMLNAYHLGIVCGEGNGLMEPDGLLSRAAACKILLQTEAAQLWKHENRVKPACFEGIRMKFVGDAGYQYYNEIADVLVDLPQSVLQVFGEENGTILLTDEDQSKYIGDREALTTGCYLPNSNKVVCFAFGEKKNLFWGLSSTLRHELGHFVYDEVLEPHERRTVRKSFRSAELDVFSAAIHDAYCRANENEYFAEMFAEYLHPQTSQKLVKIEGHEGLNMVRNVLEAGA